MCSSPHGWVYDWQTLIAGIFALAAGVGTVWGTLMAANRQVKAAHDAADREIKAASDAANRQITAAQQQTAAAQHQTEVMRDMERRRIAREGYAFYAMLEAAMGAVIDDVGAAQELPQPVPPSAGLPPVREPEASVQAYAVRQRIKRAGFAELRTAFLRFGGTTLTDKFLRLDKEIEDFASQYQMRSPPTRELIGLPPQGLGTNAGIDEGLQSIQQQATDLRYEAERGIEITRSVLGDDLA